VNSSRSITQDAAYYSLDVSAGPFASASRCWSTVVISRNQTAVTIEGFFTPSNWLGRLLVWPLARPMIRRLSLQALRELYAHLLAPPPGAVTPPGH
jgi:hypothetical protein